MGVNIYDAFEDFCRIYAPHRTLRQQLNGFIAKYPYLKEYKEYLLKTAEKERKKNVL